MGYEQGKEGFDLKKEEAEQALKEPKELKIEDKLFTVKYNPSKDSHIKINHEVCKKCKTQKICLSICPAKVYTEEEGKEEIHIAFENCLECGTCRIACTDNAIDWQCPQGGMGVCYRCG